MPRLAITPAHNVEATSTHPSLWALQINGGPLQPTFSLGLKGKPGTRVSASDWTALASAVPVVGKLHMTYSLTHHVSVWLEESLQLDKPGVNLEGSLGLSVNLLHGQANKLSLYADANWADLLNDASLQNLVAHIGLRYQFL